MVVLAAASSPAAHAAPRALWGETTDGVTALPSPTYMLSALSAPQALSAIANDIVGATDMQVMLEDDPAAWASVVGAESDRVLGFVSFRPPPSPLYHAIFLGPTVQAALSAWLTSGTPAGNEYEFAKAAMSLVHESFHWRLLSGDESTVNACALQWLPYYLTKDMNLPDTITQVTTEHVPTTTTRRVPVTKIVVSKQRVRVKGKWVVRTVRKPVTTYVVKTTTTYTDRQVSTVVANPVYTTVVANAQAFYTNQPAPYNSGTCSIAPPTSPTTPTPPSSGYHVKTCWAQYTAGSWDAVTQSAAATQFSAADILARGAPNFWFVVQLDGRPASAISGVTETLIEPNGATFASGPLSKAWPTTATLWATSFNWTWTSDGSLFFQHPASTGSGTWTLRWAFPDGEVCNSSVVVGP